MPGVDDTVMFRIVPFEANRGATVRMGSRYNDTLGVIWLSDSDLPNQDVWG